MDTLEVGRHWFEEWVGWGGMGVMKASRVMCDYFHLISHGATGLWMHEKSMMKKNLFCLSARELKLFEWIQGCGLRDYVGGGALQSVL